MRETRHHAVAAGTPVRETGGLGDGLSDDRMQIFLRRAVLLGLEWLGAVSGEIAVVTWRSRTSSEDPPAVNPK